jgi:hypothetical protein
MNARHTLRLYAGVVIGLAVVLYALWYYAGDNEIPQEKISFVITETNSRAFTVGQTFSGTEEFFIAEGDAIEVLAENGLETRIVGPFVGKITVSRPEANVTSRGNILWRAVLGRDNGVEVIAAAR